MPDRMRDLLHVLNEAKTIGTCIDALAASQTLFDTKIAGFRDDLNRPALDLSKGAIATACQLGWSETSARRWYEGGAATKNPLFDRCINSGLPQHWSLSNSQNTKAQKRNFNEIGLAELMSNFGIASGTTVPVLRPFGRIGCVSWMRPDINNSSQIEKLYARQGEMMLFAHQFIESIDNCSNISSHEEFSSREIECLQWIAEGKSNREIATIIHRSVETVHFHVKRAMTKLGATKRSQAVTRAHYKGLIKAPQNYT